MPITKKDTKLTNVQLQQQLIHLKSEVKKYLKKINEIEQRYDVQQMKDVLLERDQLIDKNIILEKSFMELHGEKQELEKKLEKKERFILDLQQTIENNEQKQLSHDEETDLTPERKDD